MIHAMEAGRPRLDPDKNLATIEHRNKQPANSDEAKRIEQGSEGLVRNNVLNRLVEYLLQVQHRPRMNGTE
jgi:hypothetical protein